MTSKSYAYKYNTRKKTHAQLEKELVGDERWDILDSILKELLLKKGEKPKQHWMLVGPRGIGKSHLLTLLYHQVKKSSDLSNKWITVLFPEELRMINDLAKFLERTVNEILLEFESEKNPLTEDLRQDIKKIKEIRASERSEYIFNVINWINQSSGKNILLLFENLQKTFGEKINTIDQKKLRAFLQTYNSIIIIGSATTVFNALHDHKHPFYHFFHIRQLKDLSFDDMKTMIINILSNDNRPNIIEKIAKNEARMRALYSFTSGNPRMAVLLSDILRTEVPDEMIDLMDEILDDLTPYFNAILNDTPPYQQEIMNTLALYEPAQSPKEIAGHLEMPQATIRNYLKHMKESGYVRTAFSKGRSNYYCLNEYLYRIWYQMRDSGHREETRWLMELLMMLYSPRTIVEEKRKIDECCTNDNVQNVQSNSYNKLIIQTAEYINKNPDHCRVIELCIDSLSLDKQEVAKNKREEKLFEKATKHARKKQYDKAIEIYADILKNNSNSAYDGAIEKFSKTLEINPASESAYFNWGVCLGLQDQHDGAIEKFSKVIEINPASESAYISWGFCLIQKMHYDEAIEKFSKVIEINPASEEGYSYWGICLRELGKYEEADNEYAKSIKINPKYIDAYLAWGSCLQKQDRYDEAIKQYKNALKIDTQSEHAHREWGTCLRMQGHYDEAIKQFKKVIKINPKAEYAHGMWGDCLRELGEYEEADNKYAKSIKINPKYISAYFAWGNCLQKLGRYNEAIKKYKNALKINPKSDKAYIGLGKCFKKQERYDEAIKQFKKAIKINSDSEKGYYGWASTLADMECYEEAKTVFEQHLINSKDCSIILSYGKVLRKLELNKESVKKFEHVINIHHNCSQVYLLYAEQLDKQGEKENALLAHLKYIHFDPFNRLWMLYEEYILPILHKLKSDHYIKMLYASDSAKFSKPQLGTFLILLDKYDAISEQFKSIASEYIGKEEKEKFDFEVMLSAIKISIWLKLKENKLHDAIRLVDLYAEYIKLLKTDKEKTEQVADLILSLFKLKVHINVEDNNIYQIMNHIKDKEIPFNDLFFKIWKCLSDPESIDAKRYLSDNAISDLINQVKKKQKDNRCLSGQV